MTLGKQSMRCVQETKMRWHQENPGKLLYLPTIRHRHCASWMLPRQSADLSYTSFKCPNGNGSTENPLWMMGSQIGEKMVRHTSSEPFAI